MASTLHAEVNAGLAVPLAEGRVAEHLLAAQLAAELLVDLVVLEEITRSKTALSASASKRFRLAEQQALLALLHPDSNLPLGEPKNMFGLVVSHANEYPSIMPSFYPLCQPCSTYPYVID